MLRLRVAAEDPVKDRIVGELASIDGVHRVTALPDAGRKDWVVSADLSPAAADQVVSAFHDFGIEHDDFVILRQDVIAPGLGPGSSVSAEEGFAWVEIVGEARANARPIARYVLLMMVAGVIAGLGVITDNSILIIGAMAVSPDLLPMCATCVGLVSRRFALAGRSFLTLLTGMALVMGVALVMSLGLDLFGLIDPSGNDYLGGLRGLAEADYVTVLIAASAGVAGILSFETRAANAVGVAISVTTVPASAFFGVAVAIGEIDQAWGALEVLGINLSLLVLAGSLTLLLQRRFAPKSPAPSA